MFCAPQVDADGNGQFSPTEPSDAVRLTVLDVQLDLFPDEPLDVDADNHEAYGVALVSYRDPATGEFVDAADGSHVTWTLFDGSDTGTVEPQTDTFAGAASTLLTTSPLAGHTYRLRANLIHLNLPGGAAVGCSYTGRTAPCTVVPGAPATIDLQKSKDSYHADATDTVDLEATLFDAQGNLVEDGTVITWEVADSTSDLVSAQSETLDGVTHATLCAPMLPVDQLVTLSAGSCQAHTTISVQSVSGTLTASNDVLDIATAQQALLTASVTAADGTPVFWMTSNGTIAGDACVSAGRAIAVLSAAGGSLQQVYVFAGIGDHLLIWKGQFVNTDGLSLAVDHPILISDAPADTVETVTWEGGYVHQVPLWVGTPIHIHGPADATVTTTIQSALPVEAYTFESLAGGAVPGQISGYSMNVQGATLDQTRKHAGSASLHFDGQASASIADALAFHFTDSFQVELWVRLESVGPATLIAKPGAWNLAVLSDGRIQGTITTTAGTFVATSTGSLPADAWTLVRLQLNNGLLQVGLATESASAPAGGTVASNGATIDLGNGLQGNVDDLEIVDQIGDYQIIQRVGVDAQGNLQLDSDGSGTIWIYSMEAPVCGWQPVSVRVRLQGQDTHENVFTMYVLRKQTYVELWRSFHCFFGDDPETWDEAGQYFIGGMMGVGDFGALIKNVYRLSPSNPKRFNGVEFVCSLYGVITVLCPPAHAGLEAGKLLSLAKPDSPFMRILYRLFKRSGQEGLRVTAAEESLLLGVKDSPSLASIEKLRWTPELIDAAGRSFVKLGTPVLEAVAKTEAALGKEVAERLTCLLGQLSDDTLQLLKDSGRLAETLENLGTVLKYVPNKDFVKRILENQYLRGHAYTLPDALADIAHSDLTFANADTIIGRLATGNATVVYGGCFEVRAAAYLKQTENIAIRAADGKLAGRSSTDFLDTNGIFYQCKAYSESSFLSKFGDLKKWFAAAREASGASDFSKVALVIPENSIVPQVVTEFLERSGIRVYRVPFGW